MQRQVPAWVAVVAIIATVLVVYIIYALLSRPRPAPVTEGGKVVVPGPGARPKPGSF